MLVKNSYCSYCGQAYPATTDWPRLCRTCGQTSYRNPLPVVVVLVPIDKGLVLIRRNIEPCRGTLNFPGGYLDLGETWQQGACRELYEETGIRLEVGDVQLYDVQNGLDDTLVIFGLAKKQALEVLRPFSSVETQEVVLMEKPIELGFPMHSAVLKAVLERMRKTEERT